MQQYDDDSQERVTPHALGGDEREEYLDRLWTAFTEVAVAGVIALQTAHNIIEDMQIDGEERFLEAHIPKEKWQNISFDELVGYIDEMSRAASAEYQDAAEAMREARINGAESAAAGGGSPSAANGAVTATGEEGDENSLPSAIRRKFDQFIEIMSTPKILLIASTNAVMIVVSIALIVGLAITWNNGATMWYTTHVRTLEAISTSSINSLLSEMEAAHRESIGYVTRLMTTWLEMQMQLSQRQTHEAGVAQRLRRVANNLKGINAAASARGFEKGYLDALTEVQARADFTQSIMESGGYSANATTTTTMVYVSVGDSTTTTTPTTTVAATTTTAASTSTSTSTTTAATTAGNSTSTTTAATTAGNSTSTTTAATTAGNSTSTTTAATTAGNSTSTTTAATTAGNSTSTTATTTASTTATTTAASTSTTTTTTMPVTTTTRTTTTTTSAPSSTTAVANVPYTINVSTARARFTDSSLFRVVLCNSTAAVVARRDPLYGNSSVKAVPFTNNTLCLIAKNATSLSNYALDAIKAINAKMPQQYGYATVFTRAANGTEYVLSNETTPHYACLDDYMVDYCEGLISRINPTAPAQNFLEERFFYNDTYFMSLREVVPGGRVFVGLALSTSVKKAQLQRELVAFADTANDPNSAVAKQLKWRLDIALKNLTTGVVIPRASAFTETNCIVSCEVPDLMRDIIERVFENRTSLTDGTEVVPGANYTPASFTHAYSSGSFTEIEFVSYMTMSRLDERERVFDRIISVINKVNEANIGSFETIVIGLEKLPPQQIFYAYDPCPESVFCVSDPRGPTRANNSLGIIYRYDCRNCQRIDTAELGIATIITDPWRVGRNYTAEGCATRSCMMKIPSEQDNVVYHHTEEGRGVNYAGDDVLFEKNYLNDWSILVASQVGRRELAGPVAELLGIAVAISVVMLLLGISGLVFSANRNFNIIEKDWAHFKKQIQREKDRFAGLVKGFIPPHIVDRMVGGHRVLVDQTQGATFTFIDLCSFSNESKTWQPKQISRYLAYCFFVMEEASGVYNVLRLRTIGDLFCAVATRLERTSKDQKEDPSQHPVRRAMDMSATLMLLFSPSYEHYPQNCKNFRELFKERLSDGRPTPMPVLRIGCHLGPAVGGAFSIGNTSHFDYFGPGPALANRMQMTALPGRIHVTSVIRDAIKSRDPEHCYTFDATRKTIVRGQGTIASYFVKSVLISAPTTLTEPLGIKPATKRVDFTIQKKKGTDSNASEHSDAGN